MADKPKDWHGLTVNFQQMAPKAGDPPLLGWLRGMIIGLAAAFVLYMLSLLI